MAEHQKLLVEASRDHFKSTFFSFGYPLWLVQRSRDPKSAFGVALFSYSEAQAQKNLKRVRIEIEANPHLEWLMPKKNAYVWDSATLDMSNDCYIEAHGFGSSFRGRHPKIVIIDDPSKDEGMGSMSLDQQIAFFSGVIVPASKRGSQIIITGNPVDKKDFLGWVEANPSFGNSKFFYPVRNDKGEPLAPQHYDDKAIEEKRSMIPAHFFAREYMLKRVSPQDCRFKEEWIRYYDPEKLGDQRSLYRIMTIDPAIKPGGDAMAAVVTGTDISGNSYVVDRLSWRGDFKTGISLLCDMMQRNMPNHIGIETFAFQRMYKVWLEEELRNRDLSFYIEELSLGSKVAAKAMRIESLQPKLAAGKLFFRHSDKPLIDQLILWNPDSKHNDDDEIDALAWQVNLWRRPFDHAKAEPSERYKPNTMGRAIDEINAWTPNHYLARLFQDLVNG